VVGCGYDGNGNVIGCAGVKWAKPMLGDAITGDVK
jgi:hypothetical protein